MLIRRKSSADDEYHHVDLLGVFGVITGAHGAVLSSDVYDAFDVTQSSYGTAQSPYQGEDIRSGSSNILFQGATAFVPTRNLDVAPPAVRPDGIDIGKCRFWCVVGCLIAKHALTTCYNRCCVDKKKKKKKSGGSGGGGACPSGQNKVTITCGNATETACLKPGQSACCSGNGVMIVIGPCPPATKSGVVRLAVAA